MRKIISRSRAFLWLLILCLAFATLPGCSGGGGSSSNSSTPTTLGPTLSPQPSSTSTPVYHAPSGDIKYSYITYIPDSLKLKRSKSPIRILFTGHGAPIGYEDNSYSNLENYVINNLAGIKSICDKYEYVLLMPITPKLFTHQWPYFTMNSWCLVRWVMFDNDFDGQIPNCSFYKRPDLEYVKIIDEFIGYLKHNGYNPYEKVFMFGFSSAGTQTNRFSILFPDKIAAVAIGGENGLNTYPCDSHNGVNLIWCVGTSDISQISGNRYSLSEFKKIPHFFFVGSEDTNDPIGPNDPNMTGDTCTHEERNIIFGDPDFFGTVPIERGRKFAEYLQSIGMNCIYKVYPGIDHQFTTEMTDDTFKFFNSVTPRP